MGPGKYRVEIILGDGQGHTCRRSRSVDSGQGRPAGKVPASLPPGAVAPLLDARLNGARVSDGPRITVLLHAYGPGGPAWRNAWEWPSLLQSLSTLLDQIPCRSVTLVAFDLERQEEIFRQADFDAEGFERLRGILKQTSLASVSYKALRKGSAAEYLARIAQHETSSDPPPDALILLGAWGSHPWEKLPRDLTPDLAGSKTRAFYLKYYPHPGEPSDLVEDLVKHLHGSVLTIDSPEALAKAIRKLSSQVTFSSAGVEPARDK